MCARNGLARILDQGHVTMVGRHELDHGTPLGGLRLVRRRGCHDHVDAGQRTGLDQRAGDVVAVADVRQPQTLQVAEHLTHGQEVGERLAGMMLVRERVDDRDARVLRELGDRGLGERPDDDGGTEPRQRPGGIGDRLAAAELQLVGPQHERQHAQAMRRGRERDARARGRLLEEAGQRLGRKRVEEAGRSVLHLLGQVERGRELGLVEIADREEVRRNGEGGCVRIHERHSS